MVCIIPSLALAQANPLVNETLEGFQTRSDYYTADSNPKTKQWLFLVELGHANDRVWKNFQTGNYKDALADAQYTLARFPNHPRALNLVAEIGKATDDLSMPIPYFELALKYYPDHAFTHAQYGHYLAEIGASSAGLAELREALRLDPDNIQAKAWLEQLHVGGAGEGSGRAPTGTDSTTVVRTGAKG
jgi:tetratricopeptide (TPR) repeat protein